jgi:hypothetical protein
LSKTVTRDREGQRETERERERERERETTAPTSCKIHFKSIIKTNGLVLFGEIAGVNSENHRKQMNTVR